MEVYNHNLATKDEDNLYLKFKFNQYAEQAWSQKGEPIQGMKVLSEKNCVKFAQDVLAKWKKLTKEENDSYIEQNFKEIFSKQHVDKKLGMNFT